MAQMNVSHEAGKIVVLIQIPMHKIQFLTEADT